LPTLWEGLVHWRLIVWTKRILHMFLFGVNTSHTNMLLTVTAPGAHPVRTRCDSKNKVNFLEPMGTRKFILRLNGLLFLWGSQ